MKLDLLLTRYRVDEMARAHGIQIIRLPPYHCMLNPIEYVWGYVKRGVRDNTTNSTKLAELKAIAGQVALGMTEEMASAFYSKVGTFYN